MSGAKIKLAVLALSVAVVAGCGLRNEPAEIPASDQQSQDGYANQLGPESLPAGQPVRIRKIPFEGVNNFRDLGGYETTDGYRVKWGVLYRSDNLSKLSDIDLDRLAALGLKRVVDFRSDLEKQVYPNRLPKDADIKTMALPITPKSEKAKEMLRRLQSGEKGIDVGEMVIEMNRMFVREFSREYKVFIHGLADSSSLPTVFHCTAGKDRTGFGAAITLLALNVPEEIVMKDYLLTNTYLMEVVDEKVARHAELLNIPVADMKKLTLVETRFLEAALDTIKEDYGSIDNYLYEALEIDDETMQKLRRNLLTR